MIAIISKNNIPIRITEEKNIMEALKMVEKKDDNVIWEYDAEADVLYISFGKPKKAEGIDIENGIIMRIDPKANEIVGMTILNPLKRTLKKIQNKL